MRIPAMSRITKLPESLLNALSESNPVSAPGVGNYVAMAARVITLEQGRVVSDQPIADWQRLQERSAAAD